MIKYDKSDGCNLQLRFNSSKLAPTLKRESKAYFKPTSSSDDTQGFIILSVEFKV